MLNLTVSIGSPVDWQIDVDSMKQSICVHVVKIAHVSLFSSLFPGGERPHHECDYTGARQATYWWTVADSQFIVSAQKARRNEKETSGCSVATQLPSECIVLQKECEKSEGVVFIFQAGWFQSQAGKADENI